MAYAKAVHYNHLVSWNIKGEGAAQQRKDTVSAYLNGLKPSPDILFLQEVQWAPSNLRTHLSSLSNHHELSHFSQEYSNCYNCVIFDKRKFEALPEADLQKPLTDCFKLLDKWKEWEKRGFRASQETQMRNRMCVVVLVEKREGCKFIAASLHNLNNKEYSIKMAELFLQLLALLGETTEYPVVLAGDFNANIQKSSEVTRLGFTIPEYKPTLHRMSRKSPIDVTIDFFVCRPARNASAVLGSVKADMACTDVVDSKGTIDDKKMAELHKVSNHDPLQATLHLSITKATTKSSATTTVSRRPTSSKPVAKATVTVSPPATSKATASTRIKQEPTMIPKPKPAPAKAAAKRASPKPAQPSVKPSARAKSRVATTTKTVHK